MNQITIAALLCFFAFLMALITAAVFMTRKGQHHEWALKIVLVPSIVSAVVLILVLNIDKDYLTSVIGLFGAIVGFVLRGKSE